MEEPILNRVEASGIVQLELDQWLMEPQVVGCDLASELVEGLVLMEKPFRAGVATWEGEVFAGMDVALHCTADAILPDWAWMVAASRIVELGGRPHVGRTDAVRQRLLLQAVGYGRALIFGLENPVAVPLTLSVAEQAKLEAQALEGAD